MALNKGVLPEDRLKKIREQLLRRALRGGSSEDDAKDAAQECCLRLIEQLSKNPERVRKPEHYAQRTLTNWLARDRERLEQRRYAERVSARDEAEAEMGASLPLEYAETEDEKRIVRETLRLLPKRDEQVVRLKFWLSWSAAKTAAELGLERVGTARSRLHRALKLMRPRLRRSGLGAFALLGIFAPRHIFRASRRVGREVRAHASLGAKILLAVSLPSLVVWVLDAIGDLSRPAQGIARPSPRDASLDRYVLSKPPYPSAELGSTTPSHALSREKEDRADAIQSQSPPVFLNATTEQGRRPRISQDRVRQVPRMGADRQAARKKLQNRAVMLGLFVRPPQSNSPRERGDNGASILAHVCSQDHGSEKLSLGVELTCGNLEELALGVNQTVRLPRSASHWVYVLFEDAGKSREFGPFAPGPGFHEIDLQQEAVRRHEEAASALSHGGHTTSDHGSEHAETTD